MFQEWLVHAGLSKFVELQGNYYPNLLKVFYANLKKEINCLLSNVKGITIRIDEAIWRSIAEFPPGGNKSHHGISGLNKIDIYNNYLMNQYMIGKYDSLNVNHLSKEERLCAYVITWILLPRGEDQLILIAEDVYLLHALRTKIQMDWSAVISDHMMKVVRQKEYHRPYAIFISQIPRFHDVGITNEITICCNKKNVIEKLFLDHLSLRKNEEGWIFKDLYCRGTDEVNLVNIDLSR